MSASFSLIFHSSGFACRFLQAVSFLPGLHPGFLTNIRQTAFITVGLRPRRADVPPVINEPVAEIAPLLPGE